MNAHVKHSAAATRKSAATSSRSFRTFLLMEQFAAEQIGARIAEARRLADGMTQEQLGELIGVSKRSIQAYEGGDTIPWKHLRMIGKVTKHPVDWFLYGDEETLDARTEQLVHRFERIAERLEELLAPSRAGEQ